MAMLLATIQEAAGFLNLDPSTIHKWIKQGKLQTIQIDGKTRVIVEKAAELVPKGKAKVKSLAGRK